MKNINSTFKIPRDIVVHPVLRTHKHLSVNVKSLPILRQTIIKIAFKQSHCFLQRNNGKGDYVTSLIPQLTWQRRDNLDSDVEDSSTQAMDYMLAATDQDASGNASEAFMLITGVVGKIERQMVRGVQKAWKVTLTGTDVLYPDNTLPGWRESLAALYSIREPFPLNPANTSRLLYSLPLDSDFPEFKLSTKDQSPANVTNEGRENVDITSFRQYCVVGSLVVFKFRVIPYGDAQLATDRVDTRETQQKKRGRIHLYCSNNWLRPTPTTRPEVIQQIWDSDDENQYQQKNSVSCFHLLAQPNMFFTYYTQVHSTTPKHTTLH
ncbi:hypothetical protein MP228_010055 [Amoeboaphelidium protococcarum]|nr:hypothetical protein MP228_010055 [Amoeboaphelidium protococcarum]